MSQKQKVNFALGQCVSAVILVAADVMRQETFGQQPARTGRAASASWLYLLLSCTLYQIHTLYIFVYLSMYSCSDKPVFVTSKSKESASKKSSLGFTQLLGEDGRAII